MSYFRTCPYCGVHLDPGEKCDCRRAVESNQKSKPVKKIITKITKPNVTKACNQ